MNIPPTVIKEYLTEKFKDYVISHDEFLIDSFFCEDSKKHLSVNINTGLWQCFKSKEHGNFIHLVSFIESIPYSAASKLLGKKLFDTPELLFSNIEISVNQQALSTGTSITEATKDFSELDFKVESKSLSENLAKKFILSRKLQSSKFYLGVSGKYINRLIIPFEDKNGLFYFQARNILNLGMKYLNPTYKEYGVKSSEILFPYDENEKYVIVTEGPLDAMCLQGIGANATSIQGSVMSDSQFMFLKGKKIILGYDNDDAGFAGIKQTANLIKRKNTDPPYIVRPPAKYKDWGEFIVDVPRRVALGYINHNVSRMDYSFAVSELLS